MTHERSPGRRRTALVALLCATASVLLALVTTSSAVADFGVKSFSFAVTGQEGEPFTQAGGHPYAVTTTIDFNTTTARAGNPVPDQNVKDVNVALPPGFIGDPSAASKCTYEQLDNFGSVSGGATCSPASQVGTLTLEADFPFVGAVDTFPVYNMVPRQNAPAQFAANVLLAEAVINFEVRTGGDYGLTATLTDIPNGLPIRSSTLTIWGNPASPAHDTERYPCLNPFFGSFGGTCPSGFPEEPLLTMPTACLGPLTTTLQTDSWQEPGDWRTASVVSRDEAGNPIGMTGCDRLAFSPTIAVTPGTSAADSPSSLAVDLHMPQNDAYDGVASADLKDATVALPSGVSINPSEANGLEACSVEQIGIDNANEPACPRESKIGSVEVDTPLLPDPLKGSVYLAQQNANPFGSLLAIYVTAEADGVLIKLAGKVEANPVTGQLTTTFDENPQLPFEDFKLSFFGGERAALATPTTCGQYSTAASFTSWAQPENPVSQVVQPFTVSSGPGGARCSAPGFAPSFAAGTVTNQAGGYSPFVVTLARNDGEQRFGGVSMTLPRGVVGMISHVTPCAEADADVGTCPASSQIGHVRVAVGVGGQPETLPEPSHPEDPIYLTQAYRGAPFGVAVVVHAEAGPFNLGTVVVRGTIGVDPHTAQVSITTDATGPYAMPTMLQGIPVDLKAMDIEVNKPEFMLNPTSCQPMSVAGTIGSAEGASANVSSRFQSAGCASLPFTPRFQATTKAKHTRKEGAYLHVSVESSQGQTDIGYAKVALPKVLPSELKTLQHACTEAQFNANPAGCPAESDVGTAEVQTPVLPVPLTGAAYFVSRGAQWPELVMVLQGDGVTIDLNGETHISNGVTTTTLSSVPDVPFTTFSLTLPEQEYSALAGNGNLCAKQLAMPIDLVAQNGKTVEEDTEVQVEGCPGEIAVSSHRIKGKTLTLKVYVPSAGKLQVSGKDLTGKTKKPTGRKTITVRLHEKHTGSLKTKVHLAFTPSQGKSRKKQTKNITIKHKG